MARENRVVQGRPEVEKFRVVGAPVGLKDSALSVRLAMAGAGKAPEAVLPAVLAASAAVRPGQKAKGGLLASSLLPPGRVKFRISHTLS
jgi:hypothetical protein